MAVNARIGHVKQLCHALHLLQPAQKNCPRSACIALAFANHSMKYVEYSTMCFISDVKASPILKSYNSLLVQVTMNVYKHNKKHDTLRHLNTRFMILRYSKAFVSIIESFSKVHDKNSSISIWHTQRGVVFLK